MDSEDTRLLGNKPNKLTIAKQLRTKLQENGIEEYIDLWWPDSQLDGWFTSVQLRHIADVIDELGKVFAEIDILWELPEC